MCHGPPPLRPRRDGVPETAISATLASGVREHSASGGGPRALQAAIYYTLAAILLYLAADWLLRRMEGHAGRRFEHRSLIFFALLLGMALVTFSVIRRVTGG